MKSTDAAAEAAEILRENDPRTPAEQAAIDALKDQRWVLWHAHDPDLGVLLLLSRAGLLRDKKQEAERDKFAAWAQEDMARDRRLNARYINALDNVLAIAAEELDAGKDPGDVAAWMRDRRASLVAESDKARVA